MTIRLNAPAAGLTAIGIEPRSDCADPGADNTSVIPPGLSISLDVLSCEADARGLPVEPLDPNIPLSPEIMALGLDLIRTHLADARLVFLPPMMAHGDDPLAEIPSVANKAVGVICISSQEWTYVVVQDGVMRMADAADSSGLWALNALYETLADPDLLSKFLVPCVAAHSRFSDFLDKNRIAQCIAELRDGAPLDALTLTLLLTFLEPFAPAGVRILSAAFSDDLRRGKVVLDDTSSRFLCFPVHVAEHWMLGVVDCVAGVFQVRDPLAGHVLRRHEQELLGMMENLAAVLGIALSYVPVVRNVQTGNVDCAVHVFLDLVELLSGRLVLCSVGEARKMCAMALRKSFDRKKKPVVAWKKKRKARPMRKKGKRVVKQNIKQAPVFKYRHSDSYDVLSLPLKCLGVVTADLPSPILSPVCRRFSDQIRSGDLLTLPAISRTFCGAGPTERSTVQSPNDPEPVITRQLLLDAAKHSNLRPQDIASLQPDMPLSNGAMALGLRLIEVNLDDPSVLFLPPMLLGDPWPVIPSGVRKVVGVICVLEHWVSFVVEDGALRVFDPLEKSVIQGAECLGVQIGGMDCGLWTLGVCAQLLSVTITLNNSWDLFNRDVTNLFYGGCDCTHINLRELEFNPQEFAKYAGVWFNGRDKLNRLIDRGQECFVSLNLDHPDHPLSQLEAFLLSANARNLLLDCDKKRFFDSVSQKLNWFKNDPESFFGSVTVRGGVDWDIFPENVKEGKDFNYYSLVAIAAEHRVVIHVITARATRWLLTIRPPNNDPNEQIGCVYIVQAPDCKSYYATTPIGDAVVDKGSTLWLNFCGVKNNENLFDSPRENDFERFHDIVEVLFPSQANENLSGIFVDCRKILSYIYPSIDRETWDYLDGVVSRIRKHVNNYAVKLAVVGQVNAGKTTLANILSGENFAYSAHENSMIPVVVRACESPDRKIRLVWREKSRYEGEFYQKAVKDFKKKQVLAGQKSKLENDRYVQLLLELFDIRDLDGPEVFTQLTDDQFKKLQSADDLSHRLLAGSLVDHVEISKPSVLGFDSGNISVQDMPGIRYSDEASLDEVFLELVKLWIQDIDILILVVNRNCLIEGKLAKTIQSHLAKQSELLIVINRYEEFDTDDMINEYCELVIGYLALYTGRERKECAEFVFVGNLKMSDVENNNVFDFVRRFVGRRALADLHSVSRTVVELFQWLFFALSSATRKAFKQKIDYGPIEDANLIMKDVLDRALSKIDDEVNAFKQRMKSRIEDVYETDVFFPMKGYLNQWKYEAEKSSQAKQKQNTELRKFLEEKIQVLESLRRRKEMVIISDVVIENSLEFYKTMLRDVTPDIIKAVCLFRDTGGLPVYGFLSPSRFGFFRNLYPEQEAPSTVQPNKNFSDSFNVSSGFARSNLLSVNLSTFLEQAKFSSNHTDFLLDKKGKPLTENQVLTKLEAGIDNLKKTLIDQVQGLISAEIEGWVQGEKITLGILSRLYQFRPGDISVNGDALVQVLTARVRILRLLSSIEGVTGRHPLPTKRKPTIVDDVRNCLQNLSELIASSGPDNLIECTFQANNFLNNFNGSMAVACTELPIVPCLIFGPLLDLEKIKFRKMENQLVMLCTLHGLSTPPNEDHNNVVLLTDPDFHRERAADGKSFVKCANLDEARNALSKMGSSVHPDEILKRVELFFRELVSLLGSYSVSGHGENLITVTQLCIIRTVAYSNEPLNLFAHVHFLYDLMLNRHVNLQSAGSVEYCLVTLIASLYGIIANPQENRPSIFPKDLLLSSMYSPRFGRRSSVGSTGSLYRINAELPE